MKTFLIATLICSLRSIAFGQDLSAVLTWQSVIGAEGYKIERNSGTGYSEIAQTKNTKFRDITVQEGKRYCYRVRAFKGTIDFPYTTGICDSPSAAKGLEVNFELVAASPPPPPFPPPPPPPPALGATYHISPSGSDQNAGNVNAPFQNIQKAVSIAKPGDQILVGPGQYNKFVGIWADGRYKANNGTPTAPIALRALPGVTWVTDPKIGDNDATGGRDSFISIIGRDYWIIEGFNFSNDHSTGINGWYGIHVVGPTRGIQVRRLRLDGNNLFRSGGTIIDFDASVFGNFDAVIEDVWVGNYAGGEQMGLALHSSAFRNSPASKQNENFIIRRLTCEGVGAGDCLQIQQFGGRNTLVEDITGIRKYPFEENCIDIKLSWFTTIRRAKCSGYRWQPANPNGDAVVIHLGAKDVTIEDGEFFDSNTGITVAFNYDIKSESPWYNGSSNVERVKLLNNRISAITKATGGNGVAVNLSGGQDIDVLGNIFSQIDGPVIFASGVNGLRIKDNIAPGTSARFLVEQFPSTGKEISNNATQ
jgi:hypothetical protein